MNWLNLVLHDHDHERLHLDRAFPSVRLRDDESGRGIDDAEKEANLFAAELLTSATFPKSDVAGRGATVHRCLRLDVTPSQCRIEAITRQGAWSRVRDAVLSFLIG